jgi:N-acetylglucosaminyldiphosphoundecaprenol N-acetyl-beta-D-mannosaminyltransferase
VAIGGLCDLHPISEVDLVQQVLDRLEAGAGGWIVTLNLDHLWRFERDPAYQALCAQATFRVADGMPLVWTSRLQGTPLPGRLAGSNLISSLSAAAAKHGRSIFLLGGMPGVADAAAAVLRTRHPQLRLAGVLGRCDGWALADIADHLGAVGADIVYVSLGKIAEEQLIARLRERLPATWFVGVGTSFAFLSGQVRRAPRWMGETGLEWLYRWAQEPRRLTGRYVRCIPLGIRLLGGAVLGRARSRGRFRQAPR